MKSSERWYAMHFFREFVKNYSIEARCMDNMEKITNRTILFFIDSDLSISYYRMDCFL